MSFKQTDNVPDYIFPLIKAKRNGTGYIYEELIGTGFFIGQNGYAITAGHVIDQLTDGYNEETDAILILLHSSKWHPYEIDVYEKHPTEDVGIIKIKSNKKWKSIFVISSKSEYSSCQYDCWGYPHDIAKELKQLDENAQERPELIYTEGYVRRRITRELYPTIIYKGRHFYEISEIVGGGNSGGPLILRTSRGKDKWEVFGLYIGENEKVGYAVRAEAFCDWEPEILGKSVIEESKATIESPNRI
jgi:hypothetical protein